MEEIYTLWLRINEQLVGVGMSDQDLDALERQIQALRARKRFLESDLDAAANALEVR